MINRALWTGDNAIITTYYLLLKFARNKSYPFDCVTTASMLAFAFLDENKEIIGKKLIESNLQPADNMNEIVVYQVIGQLCVLFWSFDTLDYYDYLSDFSLISWVRNAVEKYSEKFTESDEFKKQQTIEFVNENIDIMLKSIEIYWEDLPEMKIANL